MTEDILVDVKQITRYYGTTRAVSDVSFSIHKGEVLGFLGPNGAGKTTTMQILSGNLAPSVGHVTIAGHDLLADPRAAKAALGYLPEQPPLYRELTVDEYLRYCTALNRIPRADRLSAIDTAKQKCGLEHTGRRLIGNLSKGFQQRVGLAQAIIHMPPVVILDEPTAGLDPIQIREIRHFIRELGKDHSVILSTHILPEILSTCDRVQIINKGSLVLSESIDGLQRHMKSASLTVAMRKAPDVALIEKIDGVKSVHAEEDGRWRIYHEPDRDPAEALVKLASEKDWGLYELRPGRVSLEEIFVELTTDENHHAAHTDAVPNGAPA